MKRYAIIVAGGQGTRMKSTLPKQFLIVNGKPVIMHTMQCFAYADIDIVLVLNANYHLYWKQLCAEQTFNIPHRIVAGGSTRAQSVLNGLLTIDQESLVAVHDAVRPLLSTTLIEKLYHSAEEYGNAIPYVKLRESLRELTPDGNRTVDRAKFISVQTPQCFKTSELIAAFQNPDYNTFTDEASLVECAANKINLVEGEYSNIKITFAEDLVFAAAFLNS